MAAGGRQDGIRRGRHGEPVVNDMREIGFRARLGHCRMTGEVQAQRAVIGGSAAGEMQRMPRGQCLGNEKKPGSQQRAEQGVWGTELEGSAPVHRHALRTRDLQ